MTVEGTRPQPSITERITTLINATPQYQEFTPAVRTTVIDVVTQVHNAATIDELRTMLTTEAAVSEPLPEGHSSLEEKLDQGTFPIDTDDADYNLINARTTTASLLTSSRIARIPAENRGRTFGANSLASTQVRSLGREAFPPNRFDRFNYEPHPVDARGTREVGPEALQEKQAAEPTLADRITARLETAPGFRPFSNDAKVALTESVVDVAGTTTLDEIIELLETEDAKGIPEGQTPLAQQFRGSGNTVFRREPDEKELVGRKAEATRLLTERRIDPNDRTRALVVTCAGLMLREMLTPSEEPKPNAATPTTRTAKTITTINPL